jgi:hypothetical protein
LLLDHSGYPSTLTREVAVESERPIGEAYQADGRTANVVTGSVCHYLGLLVTTLGHLDEAEDHFVAAAATHEHIDAPTWLARTRLEWARMLVIRGDETATARASELLQQALTTSRALGLGNVERRAVTLFTELARRR